MVRESPPPVPGPFVQPNFLPVMVAMREIEFPISKSELLVEVGDETVLLGGRNVELRELVRVIHDDFFESEAEFEEALERYHTPEGEFADERSDTAPAALPTTAPDLLPVPGSAARVSEERI